MAIISEQSRDGERRKLQGTAVGLCALMAIAAPWSALAQDTVATGPQTPLPWAYAINTPGIAAEPDDGRPLRVPGSSLQFTRGETRNLFSPPDWHPSDHPPMPGIVAHGRSPAVYACGFCHLPNGQGRPENASLAGLPVEYILQQMSDYRNGLRHSSEPQMGPPAAMLAIGANATVEEATMAAQYFSNLKPRKWIRVVETETVPESQVAGWMYVAKENAKMEPIGRRIIEMAEDLARTELRDARSGFVAYVPVGSIARGEALVTTGGDGKTLRCSICHGEDLRGLGPVPQLAGRSPSYLARQLYDLKVGNRNGAWAALMQPAVAGLTVDDITAIAAYLASRDP